MAVAAHRALGLKLGSSNTAEVDLAEPEREPLKPVTWTRTTAGRMQIKFYLGAHQVEFLDAVAFHNASTRTDVVRRIIDEAIVRNAAMQRVVRGAE